MRVTVSVELFQDPYDVAGFILRVRDVYLGGFPANTHGNGGGGDKRALSSHPTRRYPFSRLPARLPFLRSYISQSHLELEA